MTLLNIHHLVVYTTNMTEALDFYTNKLGMKLASKSEMWSEVRISTGEDLNQTYIGLHHVDEIKAKNVGAEIVFRVSDINESRKKYEEKGISFNEDVVEIAPGVSFISFNDIDGNRLSLYQCP